MDRVSFAGAWRSLDEQNIFLAHLANFLKGLELRVVEHVTVACDKVSHTGVWWTLIALNSKLRVEDYLACAEKFTIFYRAELTDSCHERADVVAVQSTVLIKQGQLLRTEVFGVHQVNLDLNEIVFKFSHVLHDSKEHALALHLREKLCVETLGGWLLL